MYPNKEGINSEKLEYIDDKLKSKLDNRSVSDRSSNSRTDDDDYDRDEYTAQEVTDEEDVILDSDDFLSVKPSHSIATNMDKDSDVVMSTLDSLPSTVASIS